MSVPHREQLGDWLNENGLTGEGAEIGCAFGGFAKLVLAKWKGSRYHMIDPWMSQDPEIYKERQESADRYEEWFRDCMALAEQDKRVRVIRTMSLKGALLFKDGQLDFAFIDGDHSYRAALADMDAWWPKVKPGGLFGGHDFYDATTDGYFCEVKSAVTRWMGEHGLNFTLSPCSSWWCVKPLAQSAGQD